MKTLRSLRPGWQRDLGDRLCVAAVTLAALAGYGLYYQLLTSGGL